VARGITGAPGGMLMRRLVTAAPDSPRAAEVVRAFLADRFGRAAAIVDRAADRGEVPAGTDGRAVIELLGAPFYLRLLATGDPIDEPFAGRVAAATAAATRAGAFTPAAVAAGAVSGSSGSPADRRTRGGATGRWGR
jgi:tetracycline repressor-like protein